MAEVELSIVQLATAVVGLVVATVSAVHFGPPAAEALSRAIWPQAPQTLSSNLRGYRG